MKLNFKAIAVAAAMVAATSAHADLTTGAGGNSSLALVAFNTGTNAYYLRDLGTTLNGFLPNSITTAAGDGAATGTKTPEAGLNQSWADTNGTFATWYGAQTASDVRWTVLAQDGTGSAGTTGINGVQRSLVAFSQTPTVTPTNAGVRLAAGNAFGVSGFASITMGYDTTGATVLYDLLNNEGYGANTLSSVGGTSSLWYYRATAGTLAGSTAAIATQFANSLNSATISLASNGTLTYDLAAAAPVSAVPLPASVWMMGAGLAGMGAFMRRRAAAAKA